MQAQEKQVPLPLRSHTILGVCEAIGEDFGFNPLFVRVPLAAIVLYSIPLAFGLYFALGAVVLASRLLFPRPLEDRVLVPNAAADVAANETQELAKAA